MSKLNVFGFTLEGASCDRQDRRSGCADGCGRGDLAYSAARSYCQCPRPGGRTRNSRQNQQGKLKGRSYSSSTYQSSCIDQTLHFRHAVCVHSREHSGHTPCVSNVFQMLPQPPGLQLHLSFREGCHWQDGHRTRRRLARPSLSLIRTSGARRKRKNIALSRIYAICTPNQVQTGERMISGGLA